MLDKIKTTDIYKKIERLADIRNIGLVIFGIVVLAIAWSGAKTVQNNYQLQKQINTLKQQNALLSLQNGNTGLQNEFYQTDEYLELSARQNLGLAAPGEQVLVVPHDTAAKYVNQSLIKHDNAADNTAVDNRPGYAKNLEAWRDFLLGRKDSN